MTCANSDGKPSGAACGCQCHDTVHGCGAAADDHGACCMAVHHSREQTAPCPECGFMPLPATPVRKP